MSWTGFKKAVNRAGQQVLGRRTEKIEDVEFDEREKRFERFESLVIELQRNLTRFRDEFGSIIETQVEMMTTLDSYYGDGPRDGFSQEYLNKLVEFQREKFPQIHTPLDITVLQPIKELGDYNEEIHKLIKKRGRKKFDYEVMKGKLEKLQAEYDQLELSYKEKASDVTGAQLKKNADKLAKLNQEFHMVEVIYDDINSRLKTEMDQYISLRFALLDPSFESFIKLQMKLFGDLQLTERTDAKSQEDYLSGKLDEGLEDILDKMRGLDIHNM